jgi:hypothetical protein
MKDVKLVKIMKGLAETRPGRRLRQRSGLWTTATDKTLRAF